MLTSAEVGRATPSMEIRAVRASSAAPQKVVKKLGADPAEAKLQALKQREGVGVGREGQRRQCEDEQANSYHDGDTEPSFHESLEFFVHFQPPS